jgi:ureidoglycolate lyase
MQPTAFHISVVPLTRTAFASFGDVVETEGSRHFAINRGFAERHYDLATLDLAARNGRPVVSIVRTAPRPVPVRITLLERHPLSSQMFFPLTQDPFLIVVAANGTPPQPQAMRAFITNGHQGVNYHRGVWHHPLLVIGSTADFLVIDRSDIDENCDEAGFSEQQIWLSLPLQEAGDPPPADARNDLIKTGK